MGENAIRSYRDLRVWQEGMQLAEECYRLSQLLPKDELFGLTSQVRRASVSIPANIAEGCGRGGHADFGRFLQMAMGSASELEYHLLLSRDLHYMNQSDCEDLNNQDIDVKGMLATLIKKLKADQ